MTIKDGTVLAQANGLDCNRERWRVSIIKDVEHEAALRRFYPGRSPIYCVRIEWWDGEEWTIQDEGSWVGPLRNALFEIMEEEHIKAV